jgi:hypothetical protein
MSTDRVGPLFLVTSLSFERTIKSILNIRYDKIGQANVRTQTEFTQESLFRNWFILVKYDTYDTVWAVLCVCERERKNINTMHVCMLVCFLPSACASVCMSVSFFVLYL